MNKNVDQVDLEKVLLFFKKLLSNQAPEALEYIEKKLKNLQAESNSTYFITFSTLPQYFKTKVAKLSKEDIKEAAKLRKNWDISNWSLDQIARVYLILTFAKLKPDDFKSTLGTLISTSDAHDLITLYQAFPLFPYPQTLMLHATNGIRSNMISAFNAIALNNPYPADFFDNTAWNQLVLKTFFVDSPIEKVIGLKRRANLALAYALINTARERLAAHRPIKPEIWYLIGISADKEVLNILKDFLSSGDPILQQGALLACNICQEPEAKKLISSYSEKFNHSDIQDTLKKLHPFEQGLMNEISTQ